MNDRVTQQPRKPPGITLSSRLLLAFSFVMLASAVGLGLIIDRVIQEITVSERGAQLTRSAELLSRVMDADLHHKINNIAARAGALSDVGLLDNTAALQRSLSRLRHSMPGYDWIGYATLDGIVRAGTGDLFVGESVTSRPWFLSGLRGAALIDRYDTVLQAIIPLSEMVEPLRFLDIAHPVPDARGNVVGVLSAHLSQRWLAALFDRAHPRNYLAAEVLVTVIGRDHTHLMGDLVPSEIIEELKLNRRASGWLLHKMPGSSDLLVSFSRVNLEEITPGGLGWTSVLQVPLDSVDAVTRATRKTLLTAIAAMALIAGLTFAWLLRAASKPVHELIQQIDDARDAHREIAPLAGLPRDFIQVQQAVNDMTRSIRSHAAQLEITLDDLTRSFSGVSASFPGVLFTSRISTNKQWEFIYLSPSAEHYLGIKESPTPIRTASMGPNIVPDTRDALESAVREQIKAGDTIDVVIAVEGQDGVVRQMRTRAKKRLVDTAERIWDGVMFDVTDLIEARQQAAAANSAKSEFLASMSHEIRTPLNGILGSAQLLLSEAESPAQKVDLRRLIESAEILTTLLNDVLDHSKIEAGELKLESHAFQVSELLDSCAALFKADASRRGLRLEVRKELPPGLFLVGDPTRVRQIVINLLSNAMKFTAEGSVILHAVADQAGGQKTSLSVTVTDTGPGISAEQQLRLFRRFEQGDRSIYRQYGGSGLGLALVKRLLDAMAGAISVVSAPGQGSSFRIVVSLPVATPDADEPTVAEISSTQRALDILVIDDVALNRQLLRRMLEHDGHRVREADNGQSAISATNEKRFDLILMDIEMPDMNGLEVCRRVRSGSGPNRASYIVALTGYAFDSDIEKAVAAGMDAHMAKPVMMPALRALIERSQAAAGA